MPRTVRSSKEVLQILLTYPFTVICWDEPVFALWAESLTKKKQSPADTMAGCPSRVLGVTISDEVIMHPDRTSAAITSSTTIPVFMQQLPYGAWRFSFLRQILSVVRKISMRVNREDICRKKCRNT
jgi:hypothetical protein